MNKINGLEQIMRKLILIILLCVAVNSFSQPLNIKGFGDWEILMTVLSTKTTNYSCRDNSFVTSKKIKSVKQIFSETDSVNGYSIIRVNLTEYDRSGLIESYKSYPYDKGYCYELSYRYNNTDCTYEIDYKSNCGIIEPDGEIGSIRGFELLEKKTIFDPKTGLKLEEKEIFNSNLVEIKYEYNSKGLISTITKYLNNREQYRTEFKYEYYL